MKILNTTIMHFALALLFSSSLLAQTQESIEKYSKVNITIQDRTDIKELQKAGISLEGMKLEEQSVELILSEREIMMLNDLVFSYEILIDDMTKYYQERSRRSETEMKNLEKEMKERYSNGGFGFGSMGGFYTYDEVVAELDSMRMLYPNLITAKYSIGTTLEGRTIWAVKISDNPDITEAEPEVFYNSLVHAREPAGMMSGIYFMYYLLEHYGSDPEVTYLVDNRELYFVPVINPDGYVYNQQTNPNGGGMWRKNRKDNGNGCFGVDINRNFGYMWAYNNIGSNPDPCNLEFRGMNAFSEIESQSVRDFCNSRNFKLGINFHTYGDYLLYPWDYINSPTPDNDWYIQCSSNMVTFNGYDAGQTNIILYEINGSVNDWMYGEQTTKSKILTYEIEVGTDNDGFWPPPERIFPLAEENVYLNKVLAWGPGVIDNPPYLTECNITPRYIRPLVDSVKFDAIEKNPDNHTGNVFAQIFTMGDSLFAEIQLGHIDSLFSSTWLFNSPEENIYKVRFKHSGLSIPSNFYFLEHNLRFTTAGPIKVDSTTFTHQANWRRYNVKLAVKNIGNTLTLQNVKIKALSNDPWVVSILNNPFNCPPLPPGQSVISSTAFSIVYDTSTIPANHHFNLKFEMSVDGVIYWKDSLLFEPILVGVDDPVDIPKEYLLSQNFPNPFNPSTKIGWQSPVGSHQTLKVFDVLGNEVATLVNEYKPAGRYEIEFDATSLPSGVYFYRLQAGSFVQTRKMILLK